MKGFMILDMQRFAVWINRYSGKCSQKRILETARLILKRVGLNKQLLCNNFMRDQRSDTRNGLLGAVSSLSGLMRFVALQN